MKNIKYLVLDVDGTMTDGKIYIGENGEMFKSFNIKDGYGLSVLAPEYGITPIVVTGRKSIIVSNRCKELGIKDVFQGVKDKKELLISFISNLPEVAYMGDDLNDIPVIDYVNKSGGITGCPKDAVDLVKKNVTFISQFNGGAGAVRDFIDWIIS